MQKSFSTTIISSLKEFTSWPFKKLIQFTHKHPSISIFLKRMVAHFPKLENFLYVLYRRHMLKASHYRMNKKSRNIMYSEGTEKTYKQLMGFRKDK